MSTRTPDSGEVERRQVEVDITPRRAALVNALIAFITLTYAVCIVWEIEAFPFSHFPMYSKSHAGETTRTQLAYVGIVGDGEVELSKRQLQAIARTRKKYLDRYVQRMRRQPKRVFELLSKLTVLVRAHGATTDPPIPQVDGMRIYLQTFDLDPEARNRYEPDRQRLLYDFSPDSGVR